MVLQMPSPTQLLIQPMVPADMAACARLMAASDPWVTLGVDEKSALQGFMAQDIPCVVARNGPEGPVLGFVRYHPKGFIDRFAYIKTVAVDAAARGQRVGEQLVSHVEQACFVSASHMFLFCSSFNAGAQRFYERLGYQRVGQVDALLVPEHGEVLFVKGRSRT